VRSKLLITSLVVLVVAAACGSSEDETTTTTTPAAETTVTTPAATTTSVAEETTTTETASAGGQSCLIGTWVLDSDAFLAEIGKLFAAEGVPAGEVSEINGSYTVDMAADGSLSGIRDEWGFVMTTEQGTVTITMDGTETGTWSATDESITVSITSTDVDVTASIEAGGVVIDFPGIDIPPTIAADSAYSCEGDVLTVSNEDVTSVLNRA
jgi:hypothetical protein